jgi:hypothetical protein
MIVLKILLWIVYGISFSVFLIGNLTKVKGTDIKSIFWKSYFIIRDYAYPKLMVIIGVHLAYLFLKLTGLF